MLGSIAAATLGMTMTEKMHWQHRLLGRRMWLVRIEWYPRLSQLWPPRSSGELLLLLRFYNRGSLQHLPKWPDCWWLLCPIPWKRERVHLPTIDLFCCIIWKWQWNVQDFRSNGAILLPLSNRGFMQHSWISHSWISSNVRRNNIWTRKSCWSSIWLVHSRLIRTVLLPLVWRFKVK